MLVDASGGDLCAVSVFSDQAGADESTKRAGEWAPKNVADLSELPAYEVISGRAGLRVVVSAESA
jgi:hypothetical protein